MAKFAILIYLFHIFFCTQINGGSIEPNLLDMLSERKIFDIIIPFNKGTFEVLEKGNLQRIKNRNERVSTTANLLRENAFESQRRVVEFLNKNYIIFESFWITNEIFIPAADASLVNKLSTFNEIGEIRRDSESPINLTPSEIQVDEELKLKEGIYNVEPGISLIKADQAWEITEGENVIVGLIGIGVRGTHEQLAENFVGIGNFGWFDAVNSTTTPNDYNGYGTHLCGIVSGKSQISVAPKSKWMACRACGPNSCLNSNLVRCGQFMACPSGGSDCTGAPRVINNLQIYSTFLNDVIQAWKAAGIIGIYPLGGSGGSCSTGYLPGDHSDVLSVEYVTQNGQLRYPSAMGNNSDGSIKPDILGPGSYIRSAYANSDNSYATYSGVDFAAAHVTGTLALIFSANPELSAEEAKEILFNSAFKELEPTGMNCGNIEESISPNNAHGYGRIDAYAAVLAASETKK